MGSGRGIFRVARRQLDEVVDGERSTFESVRYGKSSGLPSVQCSDGFQPACGISPLGEIWFSTKKGVYSLNKFATDPARPPVRVLVHEILVDGLPQPWPSAVALPTKAKSVELRFTAPYFTAPEELQFRYRLESDSAWIENSKQRSVAISGLAPGKHTIQVAVGFTPDMWSLEAAEITIQKAPAWWQTWWFKLVSVIAFVGVVASGARPPYATTARSTTRPARAPDCTGKRAGAHRARHARRRRREPHPNRASE